MIGFEVLHKDKTTDPFCAIIEDELLGNLFSKSSQLNADQRAYSKSPIASS